MKLERKIILVLCVSIFGTAVAQTSKLKKVLKVKEIEYSGNADLEKVSELLEVNSELQSIDVLNWDAYQYSPEVKFRIAHNNNQIWLKYYVKEKSIRAVVAETNGSVHMDSCVEFFFDPLGDGSYYNFEFNCIGVTHLAYGAGRGERDFVAPEVIDSEIQISSTLGEKTFEEKTGDYSWEMTIVIPATSLTHNKDIQLKGLKSNANFYKCGDKSAEEHYLSWNSIATKRPDFHRPEFFGSIIFE
ncbi:carbohydrate-binding family 9-like protein [Aurantibacter sp.]|uniref:carbohydrate-binding family 9-like protein n=1 Tax=Aurantibacter sp. TaxID=2807103 RepID=UPI003265CCB3